MGSPQPSFRMSLRDALLLGTAILNLRNGCEGSIVDRQIKVVEDRLTEWVKAEWGEEAWNRNAARLVERIEQEGGPND